MSLIKDKRIILIIPAILALIIALIPTLKYQWPLGWDIFYHIHLAKLYATQGLVFIDPLYNAPLGNKINYPPIFHLLVSSLGFIFNSDYFQIARALQPVIAASLILSITYVGSKFYGKLAGFSAGILIFSSALVSRIVLPLPENLALIFFPIAIYMYYLSLKNNSYKTAAIGGLVFGLIALTHQAATLCLIVSLTSIILVLTLKNILNKDLSVIKKDFANYGIFLVIGLTLAALWWIPAILTTVSPAAGTGGGGVTTSLSTSAPMSLFNYPGAFGYLVILLAIIGGYVALTKKHLKDIFILTWAFSMLVLSQSYWFGINVISYRVLIYALIPLAILGGYGLKSVYTYLNNQEKQVNLNISTKIPYQKIAYLIVLFVFLLSIFHGFSTVSNPKISEFGSITPLGEVSIAPPSTAESQLAQWFANNSSKKYSASFSNYYTAMIILANSNQPITPPSPNYLNGTTSTAEIMKNGVIYLVYDKRLDFSSENNTTFITTKEFLFYNKNLVNLSNLNGSYMKKVYENEEFVVYKLI
jgi:hypothetical protein